ncbi:hypothetical protein FRC10_006464 [Ceratobasidium sp. 414]|nr:hypothetical protein FRC10_006464 [Ceratobasidium sp. 414]
MEEPIKPEDDNNNAPQNVLSTHDTALDDNPDPTIADPITRPENSTDTVDSEGSSTTYADQSRVLFLPSGIKVEDQQFIVHASKIKEFARIDAMMKDTPEEAGMQVIRLHETATEFAAMLELLHTPPFSSIYRAKTFSVDALVSALTMATKYDHPGLRGYVISVLGPRQRELSAIRRIKVSRACNIPDWAPGAIDELSKRPNLLTLEEASELGDDVFKAVSCKRERENPGNQLEKNVVRTVAMHICMGFGYLILSLCLLFSVRELGAVGGYIFNVVTGVLRDVTVRMGRVVLRMIVGLWMLFDMAHLVTRMLGCFVLGLWTL